MMSTCVDKSVVENEGKPVVVKPREDRSALVLVSSAPTSQPDRAVRTNNNSVLMVRSVRDLGAYIDADTALKSHVIATFKACFAALRQISSEGRTLHQHSLLSFIRVHVVSKIDYCNSLLAGISDRDVCYTLHGIMYM